MLSGGFVKIHRSIAEWRWYKDANTFRVFVHLLLSANYEPHDFEEITVQRGQLVTSYSSLSQQLGLSIQNVRTALNHLKSTGEITVNQHTKYSVITVQNYDTYQVTNIEANNQLTGSQQATNKQLTTMEEGIRRNNKDKKDNNISEKPALHCYGEYKHIRLSDEQYEKLIADYGEDKIKNIIQRCDEYCQANGKTYRDYNLTIRNWLRRDEEQHGRHEERSSNDDDKRQAFRQCAEHF